MPNALVPEFQVRDWQISLRFYCDVLGFSVRYQRPEDGFAFLEREGAELMIDQIGTGRSFGIVEGESAPLGRGVNLQICVTSVQPLFDAVKRAQAHIWLPPEEKWYRAGKTELGNRQFGVADPDGYLLRFYEDLGRRPYQAEGKNPD